MAWKRKFKNDLYDIFCEADKISKILNEPITQNMCEDTNVLTLLCDRLLLWPTYDIRYEGISSDDKILKDIVRGIETSVIRRDLSTNTITLAVDVQSNLDQYEKHNLLVEQHNAEWERNGKPTHIVDPKHGDIHLVKDQRLDPALIHSRTNPVPDSQIYNTEQSGPLSNMKPRMERKTYAFLTYQVTITEDNLFRLGYAAYNRYNKIMYYNEQTHSDLAILIRKSIQEIWGNPCVNGNTGPLLYGISLLLQGKKLGICKNENTIPNFLSSKDELKTMEEINSIEGSKFICCLSNKFFGYGVPVIAFLVALAIFWQMVTTTNDGTFNGLLILIEILSLIVAVIGARFLSRWFERQSSILKAKENLL